MICLVKLRGVGAVVAYMACAHTKEAKNALMCTLSRLK